MSADLDWTTILQGVLVIASPAVLLAVLGLTPMFFRPLSEQATTCCTAFCVLLGLTSSLSILGVMLWTDSRFIPIEMGDWVAVPQESFHFRLTFVFDRLSVPFVILTFILTGATSAFAGRYLHRDAGYRRFFLAFAIFLLGMVVASLAGTIETLFLGWELVGLSSVLLVAFFQERTAPVINAQRVWSIYRLSDAAFLLATVALHHESGGGDFSSLIGTGPWPDGQATLTAGQATGVGMLLLIAAAGKSALIPFSGWLPRAMEGPTPSSAVFYGALSIHLGTFLLLRVSAILELSFVLCAAVVAIGLATAMYAAVTGRAQTDVKSALAYASLTQVGLITAEIGLGLRYIPLIHMIGHACLRTLQLLRSPSLLHDYRTIENAIGGRLHEDASSRPVWMPASLHRYLYWVGFHRGQFDETLDRFVADPFIAFFRRCDRMERKWTDFLSGGRSRESDATTAATPLSEEL